MVMARQGEGGDQPERRDAERSLLEQRNLDGQHPSIVIVERENASEK